MPETFIGNIEKPSVDSTDLTDLSRPEIRNVIVKVHLGCNIACYPTHDQGTDAADDSIEQTGTECYMYKQDINSRQGGAPMTLETFDKLAQRIGEDARRRNSDYKGVTFHGGEPLLASLDFYQEAVPMLLHYLPETTELRTTIQTNGTLLTEQHLKIFEKYNTVVGISLDGDETANQGRVYRNGKPTFDKVMAAIEMINQPAYRHLFGGCLAVTNLEADPLETYEFFKKLLVPDGEPRPNGRNPTLDFLLPLGGWGPDSPYQDEEHRLARPLAAWVRPIHQRWIERDRYLLNLRNPQTIINKLRGVADNRDAFGGSGRNQMVVNPNGTLGLTDTLSFADAGVTSLAASVYRHSFADAEVMIERRLGKLGALVMPEICRTICSPETAAVCGGGNIPNRHYEGQFDQPSALCGDLAAMIADVRGIAVSYTLTSQHGARVEPHLAKISKT